MSKPLLLRIILFTITSVIIIISAIFVHILAKRMQAEEIQKITIWAEATKRITTADDNTDIGLESQIIEGNTTIPVYMTDAQGQLLLSRNDEGSDRKKQQHVSELREEQTPIAVPIGGGETQYIYYGESTLLKVLRYVPLIQLLFILSILVLAFMAYASMKRAEQHKMWLGLTKETAHQLGTPVSSLNAWVQLLAEKYPDDELIPQIKKDSDRLQTISQRFSKIGSTPELKPTDINRILRDAVFYMQARTSQKVVYELDGADQPQIVLINDFLFHWAIENLCKNAVDSMAGEGKITIKTNKQGKKVIIDITDTGKGIEHGNIKKIFQPGFTTKQRGWGLGLTLTKRIIEDYHNGKIYVLNSQPEHGTTFRIEL